MPTHRVTNFGAGPSALPATVLEEAARGLLNFNNTGIGIAEISHRSKDFVAFIAEVQEHVRTQLEVPPTHEILLTQGGGTTQFAAVVLNMLARHRLLHPDVPEEDTTLDYVLTGSWSLKAYEEAQRLAGRAQVRVAADARAHSHDGKSFDTLPPHSSYAFSPAPALIYYCDNETVDGVQFPLAPAPLSFPAHSRPIPHLAEHAVVFAGAQKNLGPAGLTVLIVRRDCLADVDAAAALGGPRVPRTLAARDLCAGLVLRRSGERGGVRADGERNEKKMGLVYAALARGEEKGVFKARVREGARSWMNVVFAVLGDGGEARFVAGAEERGMKGLKGHRSVGGIRVSLYNAVSEEEVGQLVAYMDEFVARECPLHKIQVTFILYNVQKCSWCPTSAV
ncbi:phosphoserine aminotransferase [Infundibulicybe gibba]|nr:phosphoserine aminotransferase [Infundibulicybe gibba]